MKLLLNPKFVGVVMILFSLTEAFAYGRIREWRQMVYWIAAAVITSTVTL